MKHYLALPSLAAVMLSTAAYAAPEKQGYAGARLGYGVASIDGNHGSKDLNINSMGAGAFVGFTRASDGLLSSSVRGELSFDYLTGSKKQNGATTTLGQSLAMIHLYNDFGAKDWKVKPFVGLGVGYAMPSYSVKAFGQKIDPKIEGSFAWAGAIGASYSVNEKWTADLGLRLTSVDTKAKSGAAFDYTDMTLTLGARYAF
ncbi:MAG: outer membrane beta-barrel protein [Rickettsiales bacterium]|nr:outer membrane beta-barrel protein [Rickettsiales bacterium]